jgi:hypothetical protein
MPYENYVLWGHFYSFYAQTELSRLQKAYPTMDWIIIHDTDICYRNKDGSRPDGLPLPVKEDAQ